MSFDFAAAVRPDLPPPAGRWNGPPEFNFVGGNNDEASVPVDALREAADTVLAREGASLGTYFLHSGPLGYLPLREFLAGKLGRYAGMSATADEILVTSGSLQAIDLINDVFLRKGDAVIVEESNYGGVFPRLARIGVRMETVPVGAEGMDLDALEAVLERLAAEGVRPRYIYTIPTVHNPTGTIMPLAARERLVSLAREHGTPVFEDECYADLVWAGTRPPALHALAPDMTIHVGTFSKTIAPALRVGYVAADWAMLSRLISVKSDAGSGALEQMVLAEYLPGHFDDHLAGLNRTLEGKLDALTEALDREFGSSIAYERPPGGIFLWVKTPEGVDTTRLAEVALAAGVAVNPGRGWSKREDAGRWIRICFASPTKDQISDGVTKLASVCHEEFGVPEFGDNRPR